MGYKMKGIKNFGEGTPLLQKKVKNKGHMEGPIPEQNIKIQPGENKDAWIYSRGYEGENPKKALKEMKSTEERLNRKSAQGLNTTAGTDFVKRERIIDYDERAGVIEQNDLYDSDEYLGGGDAKKGAKKRKQLKKTVKTLDREAQIMRDRTRK
jgi:hypothetical protein